MTGSGFVLATSSEGRTVLEADLHDATPEELVAEARGRGIDLLWVHSNADLAPFGFRRADGYVRLRSSTRVSGAPLPPLRDADYARTLDLAYLGLWGHKQVPTDATPPAHAVVLGLYRQEEAVGLCTVFPAERLVDGPGLVPEAREPASYARLLSGACAMLGDGPIHIDSWGDPTAVVGAYVARGFDVVEQVYGWELQLR